MFPMSNSCLNSTSCRLPSRTAYIYAATVENAVEGFKCSGVWPNNPTVFKDTDFLGVGNFTSTRNITKENDKTTNHLQSQNESRKLNVSVKEIAPIPKPKIKKAVSKTQKAVVLTSSPYKKNLEMAKELQIAQIKVKELKKKLGKAKIFSKPPTSTNQCFVILNQPSTSTQAEIVFEVRPEERFCFMCEENVIEDMVECLLCKNWVHERCAGSKARIKKFVCSKCE